MTPKTTDQKSSDERRWRQTARDDGTPCADRRPHRVDALAPIDKRPATARNPPLGTPTDGVKRVANHLSKRQPAIESP